jgi:hypothetical protein
MRDRGRKRMSSIIDAAGNTTCVIMGLTIEQFLPKYRREANRVKGSF